jgi:hypothetical protein
MTIPLVVTFIPEIIAPDFPVYYDENGNPLKVYANGLWLADGTVYAGLLLP